MTKEESLEEMCEQLQELSDNLDDGKVIHTKQLALLLLNLFRSHAMHGEVLETLTKNKEG